MNKSILVEGGYSVEFSGFDAKKVLWEEVDDHIVVKAGGMTR